MSSEESSSSDTTELSDTRLQLIIPQSEEGQAEATVPVRWCVSKELIDDLKRRGFVNPMLILVVRTITPHRSYNRKTKEYEDDVVYSESSKYLLPLTKELAFIRFNRPGRNEVRALIADAASRKDKGLLYDIVWDDDRKCLNVDGSPGHVFHHHKYIGLESRIEINVPEEMFAPTPPEWIFKFVKRFFPCQEVDQCDFRRKVGLSILGTILLFTLGYVYKLVILLFALIFGMRDISWQEMLHPWHKITGVVDNVGPSLWFKNKQGKRRLSPLNVLNPLVLVGGPAVVFGLFQAAIYGGKRHYTHAQTLGFPGFLEIFWFTDLVIFCVLIVSIICICFSRRERSTKVATREEKQYLSKERKADAKKKRKEERTIAPVYVSLEAMTCRSEVVVPSVSALPVEKQTVSLKFNDFKAKICKPFAR